MTRDQLIARVKNYFLVAGPGGGSSLAVELEHRTPVVYQSSPDEYDADTLAEKMVSFALSDVEGYGRPMTYQVNSSFSTHRCSLRVLPRRELFFFTIRARMQASMDAEIAKNPSEVPT